jgi:hypothetical protein
MPLRQLFNMAALAGLVLTPQPPSAYALLSIDSVDLPPAARIVSVKLDFERDVRQAVAICHLPERWIFEVSNVVGGPAYIIAKAPDAAAAVPSDRMGEFQRIALINQPVSSEVTGALTVWDPAGGGAERQIPLGPRNFVVREVRACPPPSAWSHGERSK